MNTKHRIHRYIRNKLLLYYARIVHCDVQLVYKFMNEFVVVSAALIVIREVTSDHSRV